MNETRNGASALTSNTVDSELLATLRAEYDLADEFSRKVQAFVARAGVPAINELRYAGYHLLEALTGDDEDASDQMAKSINHCKRACYEAGEAGLLVALDRIAIFKDDYKEVVISDVLGDWSEILSVADQVSTSLSDARQKGENRFDDYNGHIDSFHCLVAICSRLDHARDELNKKIRQQRTAYRQYVLATVIGLVGLIVAVAFGLYGAFSTSP